MANVLPGALESTKGEDEGDRRLFSLRSQSNSWLATEFCSSGCGPKCAQFMELEASFVRQPPANCWEDFI